MPCTCSEQQLYYVGCDCDFSREEVKVYVWKDGYASDNKGIIIVGGGENIELAVAKAFGGTAKAYNVVKRNNFKAYTVASNSIQDTRKDNS